MKNINANTIMMGVLSVAIVTGAYLMRPVRVPKAPEVPEPVVVVETWQDDLTDALAAEDNPKRVETLRNLWSGLGAVAVPKAASTISLELVNNMAGTLAVEGLGPPNEKAQVILIEAYESLLQTVSDPLDESERKAIQNYFSKLADAAEDAL